MSLNYEISLTLFPIKHIPGENVKSKIDGFIHWDARSLSLLTGSPGISKNYIIVIIKVIKVNKYLFIVKLGDEIMLHFNVLQ